jgi:WD40 repeat protein
MWSRGSPGYDAFMSYSHELDGRLAPFLQHEVERFATPWYRVRSARVFRDNANLSANNALWESITDALGASKWFIVLASPEAARSPWVDREVSWWLANRQADHILIALTSGQLHWSDRASSTYVLPPALRAAAPSEPRWVDLRPLRHVKKLDRREPRATDAVADLAATIREIPKDELVGAHIRYHRRAMRLLFGGIAGLVVLLALTLVAGLIALQQRNSAREEARIATARELAALAVANVDSHLDFAQLVAVQAYRTDRNPQTLAALMKSVSASPHLVRFRPAGSPVRSLDGSADGRVVAAGTADGRLLSWTVDTGSAPVSIKVGEREISHVVTDANGGRIVATDNEKIFLWNGRAGTAPMVFPIPVYRDPLTIMVEGQPLAISPSGRTIAVLGTPSAAKSELVLIDGERGTELRRAGIVGSSVGLPDDDVLMMDAGTGAWSRLAVATLREIDRKDDTVTPGDLFYCCGYSGDGRYFVWAKYGWVSVEPQGGAPRPHDAQTALPMSVPLAQPNRFAVSRDGARAAVAGGGELYFGDVQGTQMQRLPGTGAVTAISFLGGSNRLVSATGDNLILWDLAQSSQLLAGAPATAPDSPNAGAPPRLAVSPDGTRLAATGVQTDPLIIQDLTDAQASRKVEQPVTDPFPVWSADGERLFLLGDDGAGHGGVEWSDRGIGHPWDGPSTRTTTGPGGYQALGQVLAARLTPDGQRIVLVDEHGDIHVREVASGRILQSWPGGPDELAPPWSERQNAAAVSADAAFVATVQPGGKVRITDVSSGRTHNLTTTGTRTVTFSTDHLIVGQSDNGIELWDPAGTVRSDAEAGNATYAQATVPLPRQNLVARLTDQGSVEITDITTRQVVGSLALPLPTTGTGEPPWEATTLATTPSGTELITATGAGAINRWQLNPDAWIRIACTAAGRDLTADEWTRQIGTTVPAELSCHP